MMFECVSCLCTAWDFFYDSHDIAMLPSEFTLPPGIVKLSCSEMRPRTGTDRKNPTCHQQETLDIIATEDQFHVITMY